MKRIFRIVSQPNPPTGGESPACDVVMNDDDDNGDSHQEVWAVFERIWSHVCQLRWACLLLEGWDYTAGAILGLLTSTYAWIYLNNYVTISSEVSVFCSSTVL